MPFHRTCLHGRNFFLSIGECVDSSTVIMSLLFSSYNYEFLNFPWSLILFLFHTYCTHILFIGSKEKEETKEWTTCYEKKLNRDPKHVGLSVKKKLNLKCIPWVCENNTLLKNRYDILLFYSSELILLRIPIVSLLVYRWLIDIVDQKNK